MSEMRDKIVRVLADLAIGDQFNIKTDALINDEPALALIEETVRVQATRNLVKFRGNPDPTGDLALTFFIFGWAAGRQFELNEATTKAKEESA